MNNRLFRLSLLGLVVLLALAFAVGVAAAAPAAYSGYPTFSILAVVKDQSVTIQTQNFPANDAFTVTMAKYGTLGIGGTVITTTHSAQGGVFTATYDIPAALQGQSKIAIRLQSPSSGYYAYNWFYNVTAAAAAPQPTSTPGPTPTAGPTATPKTTTYPTFSIKSVAADETVTIETSNLPANDSFTVTLAPYGTLGIGGKVVATSASGAGGKLTFTYDIPDELKGSSRIAIRLQSPTSGYYAYNWFYNSDWP